MPFSTISIVSLPHELLAFVSLSVRSQRLKKAYRQKSLRYHPDKNPSPDAKPIFQKSTEAYSILSDNKKRLKYDKSGDMDLEDFDIDQFLQHVGWRDDGRWRCGR